jgi:putative salt-induced outer membrane protein
LVLAGDWVGQGELGITKTSGNTDSESINLGFDFSNVGELWTNEIDASIYRASFSGETSAKVLSGDYTVKRKLGDRDNLFLNLSYLDDEFDGYREQLSAAFGYGYRVIDTEPTYWEVGLGVGYRDTEELPEFQIDNGIVVESRGLTVNGPTLVLRTSFRNQITDNTQFIDDFKAEVGEDNSFVENEASLLVSMNSKFALKAGLLVRHNTRPARDSDDTDVISTLSIVYTLNN